MTGMRLGCDLPYFADPGATRAFAVAAEDLGYDHLAFSEHVVSTEHSAFPPRFTFDDPWHETFTMLGFLAAVTSRIELCSSMLLLTLRPAALAAKQAAEIDLLSGGRLRLGVSVGWDAAEVTAIGVDPTTRGRLLEEQVEVMRLLWTQRSVNYHGEYVELDAAGVHPHPGRCIPIWMGAGNFATGGRPPDVALRRIARLADGYRMFAPLAEHLDESMDVISTIGRYAQEHGRDPAEIGIEARLITQASGPQGWAETAQFWSDHNATHLGLGNRVAGGGVDAQIDLISRVITAVRPHLDGQAKQAIGGATRAPCTGSAPLRR